MGVKRCYGNGNARGVSEDDTELTGKIGTTSADNASPNFTLPDRVRLLHTNGNESAITSQSDADGIEAFGHNIKQRQAKSDEDRQRRSTFKSVLWMGLIGLSLGYWAYHSYSTSRISDSNNNSAVSRLKKFYKNRFKVQNSLYSFRDFEFNMKDAYVPVTLHNQKLPSWDTDGDISDLEYFVRFGRISDFHLAVVIGDPLSGKTTLLQKIAFDWANGEKFNQYDIILHSEFRHLPDGIYESILDVGLAGVSEIDLPKNINVSEKRVLILIDGYDEKKHNQICNQLDILLNNNTEVNLGFDLLITSRPSIAFKRKQEATFWKIYGFNSRKQQNDYIEKHFRNSPEKISTVKSNLKRLSILFDGRAPEENRDELNVAPLATSPMMLTFFCMAHENMTQINKPALFETVVKFMIQRFDKKYPDENILHQLADSALILPVKLNETQAAETIEQWREFPQIRMLGRFAFNAKLQEKFVFESNDFDTDDSALNTTIFEGIGLLFKTSQVDENSLFCNFQFVHDTMQDFFSALYFLYWQNDTIQHVDNLITDGSIKFHHKHFAEMTFDVLIAERKEAALISISPLLSEIKYFDFSYPTIRLQSHSADELRKEHAFFQSIMRNCKKIIDIGIDGMGAAVDFAWTIKLPHDQDCGRIRVFLKDFNFVGTNELILFVSCSEHIQLGNLELWGCKFEPERLRLTVDGYLSHLNTLIISLTPEMVEKLSILPDLRFTPSEWSETLRLYFPERSESRSNSNIERLNNPSTVQNPSLFSEEEEKHRVVHHMLQIFQNISELYFERDHYRGSELEKFKISFVERYLTTRSASQLNNMTTT